MSFEIGRDGPTAVVVGVDGSEPSLRAAAYAAGLCRRQRSRLVVVYVRELDKPWMVALDSGGTITTAVRERQDEVELSLRQAAELGAAEGVQVEVVVRVGDPYQVLVEVARDTRADCVVVGSSASFGHRIAGSLAVRLVRKARWPVTVVP